MLSRNTWPRVIVLPGLVKAAFVGHLDICRLFSFVSEHVSTRVGKYPHDSVGIANVTGHLGQLARQVAGWLAGQVARPGAGPARPEIPLARIHPFKGKSLARRHADHEATRSHPRRGVGTGKHEEPWGRGSRAVPPGGGPAWHARARSAGRLAAQGPARRGGSRHAKYPLMIARSNGGSWVRRKAGLGATRSLPWKGGWHGKAQRALGAEAKRTVQAKQPCRCSPPQLPPHSAAGPAAPACAQEVESPPDGGATGPIFRCAFALVPHCSGLAPKYSEAEPKKDCSPSLHV
eukprot:SM000015S01199  [mRNA]  locus=s15:481791:484319:- [translate_table: standard]